MWRPDPLRRHRARRRPVALTSRSVELGLGHDDRRLVGPGGVLDRHVRAGARRQGGQSGEATRSAPRPVPWRPPTARSRSVSSRRHRGRDRLTRDLLDEAPLSRRVHLEEDVPPVRRTPHVDRAVAQAGRLEQPQQPVLDLAGQLGRRHPHARTGLEEQPEVRAGSRAPGSGPRQRRTARPTTVIRRSTSAGTNSWKITGATETWSSRAYSAPRSSGSPASSRSSRRTPCR